MRIIGGKYGGIRITPPAQMPHTRPTTDRAKEGLFNMLENAITLSGAKTLDLFGGTGCISYELASRGATDLTVVEKDARQVAFIKQTAQKLGIDNLRTVRADVFKYLAHCDEPHDFIFAGPPYALNNIDDLPPLVMTSGLLKPGGWFVLEHTPKHNFETLPHFRRKRNYGTTIFSIFIGPTAK